MNEHLVPWEERFKYVIRGLYFAIELKLKREIEPWNPVYGNQTDSIKNATDFLNGKYEDAEKIISEVLSSHHAHLKERVWDLEIFDYSYDNEKYVKLSDVRKLLE